MSRPPPPSPPAGPAAEFFAVELRTAAWEVLVAWYRGVLGVPVLLRVTDDGYALLGDARGRIAIVSRSDPGPPGERVGLAIEVADLEAAAARLAAAGADVTRRPPNPEGFAELLTHDPDGNRLRLFTWGAGAARPS